MSYRWEPHWALVAVARLNAKDRRLFGGLALDEDHVFTLACGLVRLLALTVDSVDDRKDSHGKRFVVGLAAVALRLGAATVHSKRVKGQRRAATLALARLGNPGAAAALGQRAVDAARNVVGLVVFVEAVLADGGSP